jgi:hypothetical protein
MDRTNLFDMLSSFVNQKMAGIGFLSFLTVMGISLVSALFISFLYVNFYNTRATGSQIHRTFPLLAISVTAIFICIQFSLPLSLGLLGALSIVRFRTPIKEPEEIGFIMLVIASSLSCAIFNMVFLGIILLIAVVALVLMRFNGGLLKGRLNDGMLIITIPTDEYQTKNQEILNMIKEHIPKGKIDGITVKDDESTISYSFLNVRENAFSEFQKNLQETTSNAKLNLFYNRSGEV